MGCLPPWSVYKYPETKAKSPHNNEDDYYDIDERNINLEILAQLMPAFDEVIDRG